MHIFHIMKRDEWQGNTHTNYLPASLVKQGFIHCCTEEQIPGVVRQWFAGEKKLLVMEIEPDKLVSKLKFENLEGGKELFPHIYGLINPEAIVQIKELVSIMGKEQTQIRQPIPIEQFVARSHFIFDEGWFLLCSGDFFA